MFSRVCRNKLIRLYFLKCQLTTGDNLIESNQRIQRPEWIFEYTDRINSFLHILENISQASNLELFPKIVYGCAETCYLFVFFTILDALPVKSQTFF